MPCYTISSSELLAKLKLHVYLKRWQSFEELLLSTQNRSVKIDNLELHQQQSDLHTLQPATFHLGSANNKDLVLRLTLICEPAENINRLGVQQRRYLIGLV